MSTNQPDTGAAKKDAPELRYKEQFEDVFRGGLAHWGDELSIGMLAEYASEVACDLLASARLSGAKEALQKLLDGTQNLGPDWGTFGEWVGAIEFSLKQLEEASEKD